MAAMGLKFSPDSTRDEPAATEEHYHVWLDTGGLALLAQAPRFRTRQAARQAAVRRGIRPEILHVMKCRNPCRFTVKRQRRRKPRKPCAHCGKPGP